MPRKARKSKKLPTRPGIRTGPTTTTPGGLLRKTVYFTEDEWRAIRQRSYETDEKYTEIIRAAVREYLGV